MLVDLCDFCEVGRKMWQPQEGNIQLSLYPPLSLREVARKVYVDPALARKTVSARPYPGPLGPSPSHAENNFRE